MPLPVMRIPRSSFQFGQRVVCHWHEVECGTSEGTITGINYDHRRDQEPRYTITEDNGQQTDDIDASMLAPC